MEQNVGILTPASDCFEQNAQNLSILVIFQQRQTLQSPGRMHHP